MHDFVIEGLGRVTPYGVYDLSENAGWVSVGTDQRAIGEASTRPSSRAQRENTWRPA